MYGGALFIQVSLRCPRDAELCKLPFALPPGLAQEYVIRTKGKRRRKRRQCVPFLKRESGWERYEV